MQECKKTNFMFECETINQLALSLEYNQKFTVWAFISHYAIDSSANLKQRFT